MYGEREEQEKLGQGGGNTFLVPMDQKIGERERNREIERRTQYCEARHKSRDPPTILSAGRTEGERENNITKIAEGEEGTRRGT